MQAPPIEAATFTGFIDLAQERLGGKALAASDEFFAEKENLLKPGRGEFIADKYTDRGKWMDGWETRRKRSPGHDWCIIQLGLPGLIRGVDIDTNHFLGNHPPYASLSALCTDDDMPAQKLISEHTCWTEILSKSALLPGSQNLFAIAGDQRWTHLRLNIYPDGGVARLRVYGKVVPDFKKFHPGTPFDLAAVENGGIVVACNDMFFGSMGNLIMPGRGKTMGDAWETRRKRVPGHDWAVVKLSTAGMVKRIEVDTAHFKGNYPDSCSIEGCFSPGEPIDALNSVTANWVKLLPQSKLSADKQHYFEKELLEAGPFTHVRINIYPDGGISRLRIYGTPFA